MPGGNKRSYMYQDHEEIVKKEEKERLEKEKQKIESGKTTNDPKPTETPGKTCG